MMPARQSRLLLAAITTPRDLLLLAIGLSCAFLGGILSPALSFMHGKRIDRIVLAAAKNEDPKLHGTAVQQIQTAIILDGISFVMTYVYLGCWGLLGENVSARIRYSHLRSLLRQEPAYFDCTPREEIIAQLNAHALAIQNGIGEQLGVFIASASFCLSAMAISFWQSPRLTGIVSGLLPLILLSHKWAPRYLTKITKTIDESTISAMSFASECLNNMSLIHALGASARLESRFDSKMAHVRSVTRSKLLVSASHSAFLCLIPHVAKALAIWQGSKEIARTDAHQLASALTFGGVYTVVMCVLSACSVLPACLAFPESWHAAKSAYSMLTEVVARTPEIDGMDTVCGITVANHRGDIKFQNVTFCYPGRPQNTVLRNMSLKIPGGSTTAIVGSSGSGKSTTARMISRLYDPVEGHIELDGIDIRDYNVRNLRSKMAIVEQDAILMDCSIIENVVHGLSESMTKQPEHPELTMKEVVNRVRQGQTWVEATHGSPALAEVVRRVKCALKQAAAYDFVSKLEHGMATGMARGGRELSGGQKLRIALARALVRNAPILILDEATAALDMYTEQAIWKTLSTELAGRTIIVITHSLFFVRRNVDNIIVVKDGCVVEEGSHQDLMTRKGAFARMVQLQAVEKTDVSPVGTLKSSLRAMDHIAAPDPTGKPSEVPMLAGASVVNINNRTKHAADPNLTTLPWCPPYLALVWHLSLSHVPLLAIGGVATVLVGVSHAAEAFVFGNAITDINNSYTTEQIVRAGQNYSLCFFAIGIVASLSTFLRTLTIGIVTGWILDRTRVLTLRALLAQDMTWHETQERNFGPILGHLDDSSALSKLAEDTSDVLEAVFVLFAGPTLALFIAWRIAIVLLASLPLLGAPGIIQTSLITGFYADYYGAFGRSVATAIGAVEHIRTITIYGLQEETLLSFRSELNQPYSAMLQKMVYGNFYLALCLSVPNAAHRIANWWGSVQVSAGHYTSAHLLKVVPVLTSSAEGFSKIWGLQGKLFKNIVAAKKTARVIALLPKSNYQSLPIRASPSALSSAEVPLLTDIDDTDLDGKRDAFIIRLQNVTFAYPTQPHMQVIKDLSLSIPRGSVCALVGLSGSGKTTILGLIERLYCPSEGKISINGRDISKDSSAAFRTKMALVPQNSLIFNETIKFNLEIGAHPIAKHISRSQLERAARDAGLSHVIEKLPQGYETPCGLRGESFSGGEKQRLSIARALMRDAEIILLDEATSALDSESEGRLQAVMNASRGKKTIVMATHRLKSIQRADLVFWIDGGTCANYGSHQDLLARDALYRRFFRYQASD